MGKTNIYNDKVIFNGIEFLHSGDVGNTKLYLFNNFTEDRKPINDVLTSKARHNSNATGFLHEFVLFINSGIWRGWQNLSYDEQLKFSDETEYRKTMKKITMWRADWLVISCIYRERFGLLEAISFTYDKLGDIPAITSRKTWKKLYQNAPSHINIKNMENTVKKHTGKRGKK